MTLCPRCNDRAHRGPTSEIRALKCAMERTAQRMDAIAWGTDPAFKALAEKQVRQAHWLTVLLVKAGLPHSARLVALVHLPEQPRYLTRALRAAA